ncbi:MAG: hypothetical protein Ct9H300mP13_1670 [Gammaproteobacteria bacterium]|nr:MAG: hypothetical protein Ct9H300mP13_1670 [Gammaproteobacteria bacterium]
MNQTLDIRIQSIRLPDQIERRVASAVMLHQKDLVQFSLDDLAYIAGLPRQPLRGFLRIWAITAIAMRGMKEGGPKRGNNAVGPVERTRRRR